MVDAEQQTPDARSSEPASRETGPSAAKDAAASPVAACPANPPAQESAVTQGPAKTCAEPEPQSGDAQTAPPTADIAAPSVDTKPPSDDTTAPNADTTAPTADTAEPTADTTSTSSWKKFYSPDGIPYYYNSTTEESSWVRPEELGADTDDQSDDAASEGADEKKQGDEEVETSSLHGGSKSDRDGTSSPAPGGSSRSGSIAGTPRTPSIAAADASQQSGSGKAKRSRKAAESSGDAASDSAVSEILDTGGRRRGLLSNMFLPFTAHFMPCHRRKRESRD